MGGPSIVSRLFVNVGGSRGSRPGLDARGARDVALERPLLAAAVEEGSDAEAAVRAAAPGKQLASIAQSERVDRAQRRRRYSHGGQVIGLPALAKR